MRTVLCVAAVLALAGCEADGKPSAAMGAALKGFSRGFGDGTVDTGPPIQSSQPKLQATPAPVNQPMSQQAMFTGQSRQIQTVTGGLAWECEYHYGGQDFVLMFENYCPSSASVR